MVLLTEFALGHLNLLWATHIYQSLARVSHQLSKLSDIPDMKHTHTTCTHMRTYKVHTHTHTLTDRQTHAQHTHHMCTHVHTHTHTHTHVRTHHVSWHCLSLNPSAPFFPCVCCISNDGGVWVVGNEPLSRTGNYHTQCEALLEVNLPFKVCLHWTRENARSQEMIAPFIEPLFTCKTIE